MTRFRIRNEGLLVLVTTILTPPLLASAPSTLRFTYSNSDPLPLSFPPVTTFVHLCALSLLCHLSNPPSCFIFSHRLIYPSYIKHPLSCCYSFMRYLPYLGHESTTTKNWLMGFYFADESIDATTLTNIELAEILDPRGDKYRDLLNTVYDSSEYAWCG